MRLTSGGAAWVREHGGIALLTAAGAVLRLWDLGAKPLSLGEIQEVIGARSPRAWSQVVDSATDLVGFAWHNLVYRLGLEPTETATRVPAALLGIACIPVVYALGRTLHSRRLGLAAAALLTLSFFHLVHSQDARAVSYLAFFYALSWLAALRTLASGRAAWGIAWALSAGMTSLSHAVGGVYVAWQAGLLLVGAAWPGQTAATEESKGVGAVESFLARPRGVRLRRVLLPMGGALVLSSGQLYVMADYAFAYARTQPPVHLTIGGDDLALLRVLGAFLAGGQTVGLALMLLLLLLGLAGLAAAGRGRLAVALGWLLGPALTLYLASKAMGTGRFEVSHLLPCVVPFALAAGMGLVVSLRAAARQPGWGFFGTGGCALVAALVVQGAAAGRETARWYERPTRLLQGEDLRSVAAWLGEAPLRPGDVVFTNYSEHLVQMSFYLGRQLAAAELVVPWRPEDRFWRFHMLGRAAFQATDSDVVRPLPDQLATGDEWRPRQGDEPVSGRVLCFLFWKDASRAGGGMGPLLEWFAARDAVLPTWSVGEARVPAGFKLHRFTGVDVLEKEGGEASRAALLTALVPLLVESAEPLLSDMAPEVYGPGDH